MLCKSHLKVWPRCRAPLLHEGLLHPNQSHGHDWMAAEVHLQKAVLTVYVIYLTSAIGPTGVNITKLTQIMNSYIHTAGPVVMVGDWNMTAEELLNTGLFNGRGERDLLPI